MIYLGKDPVGINQLNNTLVHGEITTPKGSLAYNWAYAVFNNNDDVVIDCKNVHYYTPYGEGRVNLSNAFLNVRNVKSVTLLNLERNAYYEGSVTDIQSFCEKTSNYGNFNDNLERISIPDYVCIPSMSVQAFANRANLKIIDILFNLSKIAAYSNGYNFRSMFAGCGKLEEVRFVPNTILWMNYQLFNVSQNLSDDSLVSIANGLLKGSTQSNTITLLSTPKARCSTLMGVVEDDLFYKTDSGTISLADFITNVKGWTLT